MEKFDSKCNILGDVRGGVRNGSKEDGSDESDKGEDGKEAAEILIFRYTTRRTNNYLGPLPNDTFLRFSSIRRVAIVGEIFSRHRWHPPL